MKIIKLILLVFTIAICFYCCLTWSNKKKSKKISENLFGTNPYANYQNVINQGFERKSGVDALLFEKKKNDTILSVEIDANLKVIDSQEWRVKLKSTEYNYVMDFFDKFNVHSLTPIDTTNTTKNTFCLMHYYDKTIFICFIKIEQGVPYLHVIYNYPIFPEHRIRFRPKI